MPLTSRPRASASASRPQAVLLMLGTLRPLMFFGWIVALVTTISHH
jgi:hypothetical protein